VGHALSHNLKLQRHVLTGFPPHPNSQFLLSGGLIRRGLEDPFAVQYAKSLYGSQM
jgi:hypothetical protein